MQLRDINLETNLRFSDEPRNRIRDKIFARNFTFGAVRQLTTDRMVDNRGQRSTSLG